MSRVGGCEFSLNFALSSLASISFWQTEPFFVPHMADIVDVSLKGKGLTFLHQNGRVSIITNGIVVFYIAFMPPSGVKMWWTVEAMVLRLGSIGVNLFLLNFLKSRYVTEFFARPSTALAADSTANAAALRT